MNVHNCRFLIHFARSASGENLRMIVLEPLEHLEESVCIDNKYKDFQNCFALDLTIFFEPLARAFFNYFNHKKYIYHLYSRDVKLFSRSLTHLKCNYTIKAG